MAVWRLILLGLEACANEGELSVEFMRCVVRSVTAQRIFFLGCFDVSLGASKAFSRKLDICTVRAYFFANNFSVKTLVSSYQYSSYCFVYERGQGFSGNLQGFSLTKTWPLW